MRHHAVIATALALAACQTVPEKRVVEQSRIYALPKSEVWADVVAWAATQQIYVSKADEASGVMSAEQYFFSSGGRAFMDCGLDLASTSVERRGFITVNVVPTANGTTVTIHPVFREFRDFDWDTASGLESTFDCQSTGALEASLLDAIQ